MTLEQFAKLKEIVEKELQITEDNIEQMSIKSGTLYHKYLKIYSLELQKLKEIAIYKEKVYGELYHKYKFEGQYQLSTKTEVDVYVKSDGIYYKKCLEEANQEIIVKYLEAVVDSILKNGFQIKNYIELMKLKQGMN
jgi:hypothetical protein